MMLEAGKCIGLKNWPSMCSKFDMFQERNCGKPATESWAAHWCTWEMKDILCDSILQNQIK